VKIKQYCSVCKAELDMEVVPTADGEDEGVLWLRCPRCQGFLPKISSSLESIAAQADEVAGPDASPPGQADLDATVASAGGEVEVAEDSDESTEESTTSPGEPSGTSAVEEDPIAAYAAMLRDADLSQALPYRSWERYEIGDVIHHLAWDDCGVVVGKETLPGERKVVKVFFEKAGVVRLIEEDSRSL